MTDTDDKPSSEPARARALFSTADFKLLRAALESHGKLTEDQATLRKITDLHHRLGTYS